MSPPLSFLPWDHTVEQGPEDVGSEQRWKIVAADGRRLAVAQLAPDLARDESIRRRWVRDAERIASLEVHSLAAIIAIGPEPDPRAPEAAPPWRVRVDPEGEPLSIWLQRAPVTLEEFTSLFAALADALVAVHATGAVLRDLRPEQILRTTDGRIVLADVGLSRVDVLSSHTASSLLLQGSTYAAPEQVATTAVDLRSDLFSMGVMMWQALTGTLPFEDGPAFLRREVKLPRLTSLRRDVPETIDLLVRRCLSMEPSGRPPTASAVAWILRGGAATSLVEHASTKCQHCTARLRVGQRLCLECGRLSVKFTHAAPGQEQYGLDLRSVAEDASTLKWLQSTLVDVSQGPIHKPEFLVGSVHLYSDDEKAARIRVPARLYNGLSKETAQQLHTLLSEKGVDTEVVSAAELNASKRTIWLAVAATVVFCGLGAVVGLVEAALLAGGIGSLVILLLASSLSSRKSWILNTAARFQLRPIPAALPASDPLVARLAGLLRPGMPDDVRAAIAEMALLVQRLVDHRGAFVRDAAEIDMLTQPLQPLVESVARQVELVLEIDAELASLDEGTMVRALAAAEARGQGQDTRAPVLAGLDRLRTLEDQRAAAFRRLLDAQSLLTRTVELGLTQHDAVEQHERQLALAVATLTGS